MQNWRRKADESRIKYGFVSFVKKNCSLLIILVAALITVLTMAAADALSINKIDSEENARFKAAWSYSVDGGEFHTVELPHIEKGEINSSVMLKNTLPQETIKGATVLLRTSQQNVEVFVAGELVYRDFDDVKPPVPSSAYHFARMPENAAGKEITVELSSPYSRYAGCMNEIFIGSKASNVFFLLREGSFRFIIGIVILMVGLLLTLMFLFAKEHINTLGITYLGAFFASAGFWVTAESKLLQFIIPHPLAISNASVFALTLLPVFVGLYYYSTQPGKLMRTGKAINAVTFLVSLSVGIIAIASPMLTVALFPAYLVAIGMCMLAVCGWIIADGAVKKRKASISVLGIAMFSVFGLAELVFYLSDVKTYNRSNLMTLGLLVFCVMLFIDLAQNFMRVNKDAVRVKTLTVLAYTDSLTGLPNRTAFLEKMANANAENSHVLMGMFDVNYLKQTNDSMGHLVGDALIRHSVKAIKSSIREEDELYRIGGDEFATIIEHDGGLRLSKLEKRLTHVMEKENQKALSYRLSIAYGFAEFTAGRDKNLFETLALADKNMYDCKRRQKNLQSGTEPGLENGNAEGYASD